MATINNYIEKINFQDKHFIGTIAFKSEQIVLPNGTKMALGIDGSIWVLIYQSPKEPQMKVYKYDHQDRKIAIDQKPGKERDILEFKKHINYFFSNARTEDLVTLLPPHGGQKE
jgi:hypothetical protein